MSALRENLEAVRALIAKGWTRDISARDKNGTPVHSRDARAVCWCLHAAVIAAVQDRTEASQAFLALDHLTGGPLSTVDYNDAVDRTQAEVLALIDRAIEAAA